MTPSDQAVLKALGKSGADWVLPFDPICRETKLDRRVVRLSCRRLARKGLAQYHRGLMTDEGMAAGAGYAVTEIGRALLQSVDSSARL